VSLQLDIFNVAGKQADDDVVGNVSGIIGSAHHQLHAMSSLCKTECQRSVTSRWISNDFYLLHIIPTGLIPQTLGPSNDFTLLNGWICLHGVLD